MRRFFIVTLILLAIDSIHSQETISPIDAPALEHIWNRIADNSPKLRYVESAEFSPDGLKCASVSKFGNLLSVWEVADGSLVLQNKLDAEIECVSYSPDGEQIACGDEAFYVTVWDAATSEQVAVHEHDAGIDGFTWSNDGQYLVAGTEKCDMWFWNPDTWEVEIKQHCGSTINSLCFSSNDAFIIAAGNNKIPGPDGNRSTTGFVNSYRMPELELYREYVGHTGSVK